MAPSSCELFGPPTATTGPGSMVYLLQNFLGVFCFVFVAMVRITPLRYLKQTSHFDIIKARARKTRINTSARESADLQEGRKEKGGSAFASRLIFHQQLQTFRYHYHYIDIILHVYISIYFCCIVFTLRGLNNERPDKYAYIGFRRTWLIIKDRELDAHHKVESSLRSESQKEKE
jgi:hypothetical protein